ncbi:MAG: hypothetical protein K0U93_25665 [Gammaproteobacteria bacterium]|nr:hypothetical protein [Gammaproteobacteria bacterium]
MSETMDPSLARDCLQSLDRLEALEEQIGTLQAREVALELDQLAPPPAHDVAPSSMAAMSLPARQALGAALSVVDEKRHELATLDADAGVPGADGPTREMLEAAKVALTDWRDAPTRDSQRHQRIVQAVVLVITAAVVALAIKVHPALLLLLVPVFVPISFLFRRGENATWRRIGAQRAYGQTGMAPPSSWDVESVQRRLDELDDELATAPEPVVEQKESIVDDAQYVDIAMELAAAEQEAQLLCISHGLDYESLQDEERAYLQHTHAKTTGGQELINVQRDRRQMSAEADTIRDDVFRQLSRHRAAPTDGRTDVDTLRRSVAGLLSDTGQAN